MDWLIDHTQKKTFARCIHRKWGNKNYYYDYYLAWLCPLLNALIHTIIVILLSLRTSAHLLSQHHSPHHAGPGGVSQACRCTGYCWSQLCRPGWAWQQRPGGSCWRAAWPEDAGWPGLWSGTEEFHRWVELAKQQSSEHNSLTVIAPPS